MHLIDTTTGIAAAWNRNQKSWHGLGSTLDTNDATEIIRESGLDWEVEKTPLTTTFNGVDIEVPGYYSTTRTDTNKSLGVVKSRYAVMQNRELFEFYETIGKQGVEFATAGSLKGGRVVYISAVADSVMINGDSQRDNYLVVTNTHDGSAELRVYFTSIRPVCNNTLTAGLNTALGKKGVYVSIKHTGNWKDRLDEAKRVLSLANRVFDDQKQYLEAAVKTKLADDVTRDLALQLLCNASEWDRLADDEPIDEVLSTRKRNQYFKLLDNIFSPASQQGISGTALGFLEGVTYYTSHTKEKGDGEKTAHSLLFGSGLEMQENAVKLISPYVLV